MFFLHIYLSRVIVIKLLKFVYSMYKKLIDIDLKWEVKMDIYKDAEEKLSQLYDIDLIKEILLARTDRAIYYVEFLETDIHFTKISGKSPMDLFPGTNSFSLSLISLFCNL